MTPSTCSTESPIVLNITSHDQEVTNEVVTKSVTLDLNKVKNTLKMSIDGQSCNVPIQYYDGLRLLKHQLRFYQRAAVQLMEFPPLNVAQATYTSIAYYYCDVLLAFVQEVKDTWRRASKTWRSAHVDYHFTMAIHGNAFLEPMQKEVTKKINLTWDDFTKKKIYEPVTTLTIHSYHKDFCMGNDMCGVPDAHHDRSVEDMISSILQQSKEQLKKALTADQGQATTSTLSHAEDDRMHDEANMVDIEANASSSNTNKKGGRRANKVDHVMDMSEISFKAQEDLRKARLRVKRNAREKALRKISPVDEDMIDEAANDIQEKEDVQKGRKTRKGGHQDKDTMGSTTSDRKSGKSRSKHPPNNAKTRVKSKGIVDSDDEPALPAAELNNASMNVNAVGSSMALAETDDDDVDGIMITRSSPVAIRPDSGARTASRKGKGKAIVLSDDEADSDDPELSACGRSAQDTRNISASAVGDVPTPTEKHQCINDVNDIPDINTPVATSDDVCNSEDTSFPSAFHDWDDWNHIAFEKGNSQIFLKLGAWILLRFRQLTQTPIHGNVNGLVIPDHPSCFEIENEADFNEALGMARLYSALTHVDTHPEFLAHLFHELGKASSEGRLECSRPDIRQLPEPPTPILSMMADEKLPWLRASPVDEYVDSVDMDADGEFDDGDGDASIAMALDDMDISGIRDSVEIVDCQDAPRRKRTMSTPLSPPKDDGGRGFPKRSRASHNESFCRPSSPVVRSTLTVARTKSLHSESTQDKGVPIDVIHFIDQPSGFVLPQPEGDEIVPGRDTIPDVPAIPNPPLGDNGAISDISAWTESEEESRMQISSHSEDDEVVKEDADNLARDAARLGIVSSNDSDGQNIGPVVDNVDEQPGEDPVESIATPQPSMGDTHGLDEDVRVFVPSTPE